MSKIHRVVQLDYWTSPGTGQRMLTVTGPKGAQQTFMLAGEIAPNVDPVQLAADKAELLAELEHAVSVLEDWDDNIAQDEGPCETVVHLRAVLAKHKGAGA